ncbi:MAG: DUF1345 domain-containing protein [Bacteroidetes bacterium]|nr:DUF1345 domain-containing protein [Bacteroidota bacterium]
MANPIKTPTPHVFMRMDAQHRFMISLLISIVAFLVVNGKFSIPSTILLVWMAFAVSSIIMIWITFLSSHPREVRKIAKLQDSSRAMLFTFVIVASVISLTAVYYLLKSSKHGSSDVSGHILLAITAVFISWWLVHTIFTTRYAHLYYDTDKDDGSPRKGGGLQFPDETEPDYLDFVYFSFVIGMTFQVSDVEISSRHIRRLAWLHGLISFVFNTAIVALSINVISGLVS